LRSATIAIEAQRWAIRCAVSGNSMRQGISAWKSDELLALGSAVKIASR
jgi:hypothetical protein